MSVLSILLFKFLCEINFDRFSISKLVIFTPFKLKLDQIDHKKIQKWLKVTLLELLNPLKLISRKFWFLLYSVKNSKIYSHLFFQMLITSQSVLWQGPLTNNIRLTSHITKTNMGRMDPTLFTPLWGPTLGGHRGIPCPFLGEGAFPQLPPGVTPWTPITITWRLRPQLKPGTTMNVLKPLTINFHSVKFHEIFCHLDFTHWVLGGCFTFKKIHRSWDMCFLMQNDMGINVY